MASKAIVTGSDSGTSIVADGGLMLTAAEFNRAAAET
jgi:hypothetical protein